VIHEILQIRIRCVSLLRPLLLADEALTFRKCILLLFLSITGPRLLIFSNLYIYAIILFILKRYEVIFDKPLFILLGIEVEEGQDSDADEEI
jgi:hypothetical protein